MYNKKIIRNFSIIAHIDHGKSTLADRILEITDSVERRKMKERIMDTMELEQERGITIKLQTARMSWRYSAQKEELNGEYVLNMIDTPGHVDFSYEVSRSIAACEGVVLLVDSTKGIQAQTIANFYKALENDVVIIPAISKIDLASAKVEETKSALREIFGFNEDEILLTSGKDGQGVKELLNTIVERVPFPKDVEKNSSITKALIFDSFYHEHKGVVALIKVFEGTIAPEEKLYILGSKAEITPIEVGYLHPELEVCESIKEGEVGYIATGLKEIKVVYVGDTVTKYSDYQGDRNINPLHGYTPPKSMVYASLYPVDADQFSDFQEALQKLSLNDAALTFEKETSMALGSGFCCGFLGLLHLEITQERISREFGIDIISTIPSVSYKVKLSTKEIAKVKGIDITKYDKNEDILYVRNASEFPDRSYIQYVEEPWVKLEIFTPSRFMGGVIELCKRCRGNYKNSEYLGKRGNTEDYQILRFEIPLADIIVSFFDDLKSITSGYASMDYNFLDYRMAEIVKVTILANEESIEPLSFLSIEQDAQRRARMIVKRLKDLIPSQLFKIPIQAAIGGKIIAREDIRAQRKDVTAKLYGGDVTRKRKLLEKQKKGKQRMKMFGKVEVPKEVFLNLLKSGK